ncbi:MAG: hypothetical protein ABWY93_18740 [Mycobacterium sp.]
MPVTRPRTAQNRDRHLGCPFCKQIAAIPAGLTPAEDWAAVNAIFDHAERASRIRGLYRDRRRMRRFRTP